MHGQQNVKKKNIERRCYGLQLTVRWTAFWLHMFWTQNIHTERKEYNGFVAKYDV